MAALRPAVLRVLVDWKKLQPWALARERSSSRRA
jgi:hypothetical protein